MIKRILGIKDRFRRSRVLQYSGQYVAVSFIFVTIIVLVITSSFLSDKANGQYKLGPISYFIDINSDTEFTDILNLPAQSWEKTDMLRFTEYTGKVWIKLALPAHNESTVLLRFKNPLLDNVDVKVVALSDAQRRIITQAQTGDKRPFAERLLALPNFVIPLDVYPPDAMLYISADSLLSLEMEFGLWSNKGFIEFNDKLAIFFGIIFGYILALFCYSFLMYATVKKSEYMWYGFYLGAFLLHAMSLSGFAFQYLWPQGIGLQAVMGGVSISLTYLCLVKFTQIIIATTNRKCHLSFNFIIYFHVALCTLSIISLNPEYVKLHMLAVLVTSFVIPILCFITSREGSKVASFFAWVWLVFLTTSLFAIFGRLGIYKWHIDHIYTLFLGFHIETLLIGAALIYSYRATFFQTIQMKEQALRDKEASAQSKNQILNIQQQAQSKLEQQVRAQTLQLEAALSKLSLASTELTLLRNLDGLTGLPNRLAFEESLLRYSKSSMLLGRPLCAIVLDIDHFKKINDTYGHISGDDCLRAYAALLNDTFGFNDYAYCRFGGEEFFVVSMLPITHVFDQAEKFRIAVEALKVNTGGHIISFTTSAGVACIEIMNVNDTQKLLSKADENLYLAKQKGRNLVLA